MKQKIGFVSRLIAFALLLSSATTCTVPGPAPTLTTPNVETRVAQTVEAAIVDYEIATRVAATLGARAAPSDEARLVSSENAMSTRGTATLYPGLAVTVNSASTVPTVSPSLTLALPPTVTLVPTTVPTRTPEPSGTAIASSNFTRTRTPAPVSTAAAFKYAAPQLASPQKWEYIVGPNVNIRFTWTSTAVLAENEWFDVWTRWTFDVASNQWSNWCRAGWTRSTEWVSIGIERQAASNYCFREMTNGVARAIQWVVIVQRFVDGEFQANLSPESERWEFIWQQSR